jgi:excisionase family DNA binding protein
LEFWLGCSGGEAAEDGVSDFRGSTLVNILERRFKYLFCIDLWRYGIDLLRPITYTLSCHERTVPRWKCLNNTLWKGHRFQQTKTLMSDSFTHLGNSVSGLRLLYTIGEVGEMTHLSVSTLSRERRKGNIKAVRIGRTLRFTAEAVQAFINQRRAA